MPWSADRGTMTIFLCTPLACFTLEELVATFVDLRDCNHFAFRLIGKQITHPPLLRIDNGSKTKHTTLSIRRHDARASRRWCQHAVKMLVRSSTAVEHPPGEVHPSPPAGSKAITARSHRKKNKADGIIMNMEFVPTPSPFKQNRERTAPVVLRTQSNQVEPVCE